MLEGVKKNTLLIVDDDKPNLMVLSQILYPEYDVRVASNGKTAIELADKFLPDLILMDILMPDMNGYQVLTELRGLENTASIPIIFITGLSNNADEKKGLVMGAVDYISKPFDETIVKLRVRHQIQIINQMRTIERLSMMDQLTEIPNRRNFDNRMQIEWGRAMREHTPLSLLLVDVDHFKIYNDTYGHQQGDKALCMVAKVLTWSLRRSSDLPARWGGEEFVALLPNTDHSGGIETAERIRENIEAETVVCTNGDPTKVTVSVGMVTHMPTPSCSIDEFMLKSDKALYKAKESGRNTVCVYDE